MKNITLQETLETMFSSPAMNSKTVSQAQDLAGETINELRANCVQLTQLLGDQLEKEKVLQDVVNMYQSIDTAKRSLLNHALSELTTRQERFPYDVKHHQLKLISIDKKVGKIDIEA